MTASYSPTGVSTYAWVRTGTEVTTEPSGAITPVMPLMAATTTYRWVSIARSRLIANCWSIWAVWMNIALLVWTTTSWPPWESWA